MFWMPCDAGEKVSLGITVLLAFSVFQLVIAESTPKTSDYFPVIVVYVAFIMSVSAVSTVTAIVILYLNFHPCQYRPPRNARVFLFEYVAKVLCMYSSVPHDDQDDEELPSGITKVRPVSRVNAEKPLNKSDMNRNKTNEPAYYPENESMKRIAEDVNVICDTIRNKAKMEQILDEWKGVARVVDRMFFWICSLIVICTCAAIFSNRDGSYTGDSTSH